MHRWYEIGSTRNGRQSARTSSTRTFDPEIGREREDVKLTWTDPKPTAGKTSYYYVRGEQVPDMDGVSSGELVWASPMWIKYDAAK